MNQSYLKNIEWNLLRGTLIWTLACFFLGVSALVLSYEHKVSKKEKEAEYELNLRSLSNKLKATISDETIYSKYLPRIEQQIKKGYIGDLNRVVWVDILHDVTSELRLPDMQYNISEQTNYIHNGNIMTEGDFVFVQSLMQISMNLFHEEDLFNLLEKLRKTSHSYYQVDQCSIRQTRRKESSDINEPNLSVQCDLVWIALQYPESVAAEFKKRGEGNASKFL